MAEATAVIHEGNGDTLCQGWAAGDEGSVRTSDVDGGEACGMCLMKDSKTVAHRAQAKELLVTDNVRLQMEWFWKEDGVGLFIH